MRWSFYITLVGIVITALVLLALFLDPELISLVQSGSHLLQLGGVVMIIYGIIKTLRDSGKNLQKIFAARETMKGEPVTISGSLVMGSPIVSGSGYIPQTDVPIEERLETLEKRQVKLFTQLGRVRKELEQEISSLSKKLDQEKNRRRELADRLREERKDALVSNLHLEIAGSAWVMLGIALQLFQQWLSG